MTAPIDHGVLGMLYIVDVRGVRIVSKEKVKQRFLLVGCAQADIERKVRWLFDASEYSQLSITGIEKVRDKVHVLSTVITPHEEAVKTVIDRGERQQVVQSSPVDLEPEKMNLYAVGITTKMFAWDEEHCLRRVATAVANSAISAKSASGVRLSDDSTVVIERISRPSGYAKSRDVSTEINKAKMLRG